MARPQNRRSIGPAGSDRVSSLSNSRNTTTASTSADGEVDVDGAAAERGRGRGEQHGGRRDEAAAEADDGDQRGEAAEDEDDRLRIEAFALGEIAAPGQPEIAGGEQGHAGRDDVGHGLRARRRRSSRAAARWCPRRSPARSAAARRRSPCRRCRAARSDVASTIRLPRASAVIAGLDPAIRSIEALDHRITALRASPAMTLLVVQRSDYFTNPTVFITSATRVCSSARNLANGSPGI